MKNSGLERMLSLLCVLALVIGMVSTSALAATPMMGSDAVAETPAGESGGHTHANVTPERPAAQVGAQRAPTYETLSAELMATGGTWTAADNSSFAVAGNVTATVGSYTLNFAKNGGNSTIKSAAGGTALVGKFKFTVDLEAGDTITVSYNAVNSGGTGLEAKSVTLGGTTVSTTKKDTAPGSISYTATAAGSCEMSCTGYLAVYSITITPGGPVCEHTYDAGEVTKAATCTAKGEKTFACTKCGETKTEELDMVAHSYTVQKSDAVAPNCYQPGKTAVMQCVTCTATQGGETVPATNDHIFGDDGKCTTQGCEAVDPDKCQHTNQTTVSHKDATCTEPGVVGGSYCADCGEGKEAAEAAIPATGHSFVGGVCACGQKETTGFIAAEGWLESVYALWPIEPGVTKYEAYVIDDSGTETQVDDQLIRQYPSYMRVDALGLKAGSYTIKVVDDNGKEMVTNPLTVKAHDRSGFAFVGGGTASGAYNDDGTLKSDAQVIYVTKAADIETYQSKAIWSNTKNKETDRPVCVRVVGHVKLNDVMGFQDWTTGLTIEGVGNDAILTGGGIFVKGCTNVEVRNLGVMHVPSSGKNDLIAIEQTNDHIWVHNCDLFYGFAGSGDQAKGDGSLDVKDAENCSFSYNHFWDSGKCSLLGNSSKEDKITYHHNWFDHSDSRHPRTRSGDVHVYNNYYDGVSKYGVGVTSGCGPTSAFVEANYFRNTKYPMLNSTQASDAKSGGGSNTFGGDGPGFIKAYNNVMVGSKDFVSQMDNPDSFDGYVVSTRDTKVPSGVAAGGATYDNFDTSIDLGVTAAQIQSPADAVVTVTRYAGRVGGGDIKWDFDDAVEDTNYSVIEELATLLNNYKTTLVSVGGTVDTAKVETAEHTHRAGAWITTKVPGCDPATKKLVNGEETHYCVDCDEVMETRTVVGAHSNDGQGVCQVCGEKVANGGGPVVSANTKFLKATDFKDLAKGDAVTQDMLDAKYEGYFKVAGSVKAGISSSKTGATVDHLALPNTGNGGISFTVTNGPAEVYAKVSSTGSGKTSKVVLKDANGNAVANTDGSTDISVKENVSSATTVKYSLPAGTYTIYTHNPTGDTGANGVRLIELAVTEAEATEPDCEHTDKTEVPAKGATCTEDGNIQYWVCQNSECGKLLDAESKTLTEADVVVKAKGHTYGAWSGDATGHTRTCSVCDAATEGHTQTAAHTWGTPEVTTENATCTTAGTVTTKKTCDVCGYVDTKTETGVTLEHTAGEAVRENEKAASCTAAGSYDEVVYCDSCGAKISATAKVIPAKGHDFSVVLEAGVEPTATEPGKTAVMGCSRCDAQTGGEAIPAGTASKVLLGSDQDEALKNVADDMTVAGWADDDTSYQMGTNNYFTVHYSAKAKVATSGYKEWPAGENYYEIPNKTTRFSFGGKGEINTGKKILRNLIEFTPAKSATVKVWYAQSGDTARALTIMNASGTEVAKVAANGAKNEAVFATMTVSAGGPYYLGFNGGNGYFYKVEVIEEGDNAAAAPAKHVCKENLIVIEGVAPTCVADGVKESYECSFCGKKFVDADATTETTTGGQVDPATGHSYVYVDNGDGTHTGTCANCAADVADHTVTAEHVYDQAGDKCVCGAEKTVTPDPVEVDKDALKTAIAKANTAKGTAAVSVDGKDVAKSAKWVTQAEMKALTDAIAAAEAMEKKADATQSEVDGEVAALNAAVNAFEAAKKDGAKEAAVPSGGGGGYRPSTSNKQEQIEDLQTPLVTGGPELNSKDHMAYITGYSDGTVGAERNITREETAAIFYRLLTEQSKTIYGSDDNSFPDVSDAHWANRDISTLAKAEIIKGLPDGTFGGERNITRGEFVTIAARFFTVTAAAENPFADVEDHWARNEILFAYSKGWVKGLPDGTFGPDKLITRAEAMRIINNILDRQADAEGVLEEAKQFSDVSEDAWYYYDVVEATNAHSYTREDAGVERWSELLDR